MDESSPDGQEPSRLGAVRVLARQSHVLLIDDDDDVRGILAEMLAQAGFRCAQAADALQALQHVERTSFEIVLCDMRLPGLDGTEVLTRLKQFDEDMAVIMVTAVADVSAAVQCLRLGASDYVLKPVDLQELLVAVERAVEKQALVMENRLYSRALEDQVREKTAALALKTREASLLMLNTIQSLVSTLEAKDTYTEGHSWKVAVMASEIAHKMGMDRDFVENVSLAGLLHDIGKIGVRDDILNKPGPLTPEEYLHVQQHPVIGEKIIGPLDALRGLVGAIRHHHEHFDGTGYPDGLSGDQIPLSARILALADAYDAITSERAYRAVRDHHEALRVIREESGTQFDPVLVDVLLKLRPQDPRKRKPPLPENLCGDDQGRKAPKPW